MFGRFSEQQKIKVINTIGTFSILPLLGISGRSKKTLVLLLCSNWFVFTGVQHEKYPVTQKAEHILPQYSSVLRAIPF